MKNKIKENFSIITNNIVNETRISFGAKGVACYLLSKPDGWKFYLNDIQSHSNESLFKVKKYIKELEEIGFLIRTKVKNDKGQFVGLEYSFNLDYTESQQAEKPTVEKSDCRLMVSYNNTNISNTEINNKDIIVSNKKFIDDIYVRFSSLYELISGGRKYMPKKSDFVLLNKLIKQYSYEEIMEKIDWLYSGCVNGVFWFAKNVGDFTIGKLYCQWNNILPQYTDKQRKEIEQKKEEEEQRRRVMENVREFGISQRRER